MNFDRGSEWRKWDLHLHSKYSKESSTKREIIDIFRSAYEKNISMISITDHSNFDGLDEIWDIYSNGSFLDEETGDTIIIKDVVSFLPGVELKTTLGKSGTHIIVIFQEKYKLESIKEKQLRKY